MSEAHEALHQGRDGGHAARRPGTRRACRRDFWAKLKRVGRQSRSRRISWPPISAPSTRRRRAASGWCCSARSRISCCPRRGGGFPAAPGLRGRRGVLAAAISQVAGSITEAHREAGARGPAGRGAVGGSDQPTSTTPPASSVRRSRVKPSRMRDFTVPSGRPVRSEIWLCESPSKKARRTRKSCSSGRELERSANRLLALLPITWRVEIAVVGRSRERGPGCRGNRAGRAAGGRSGGCGRSGRARSSRGFCRVEQAGLAPQRDHHLLGDLLGGRGIRAEAQEIAVQARARNGRTGARTPPCPVARRRRRPWRRTRQVTPRLPRSSSSPALAGPPEPAAPLCRGRCEDCCTRQW